MALKLQVPDVYMPHLEKLVQLSPNSLEALLQGLREEKPSLGLSSLANSIAARLSLDKAIAQGILELLSSLHMVREGLGGDIDEFVSALRTAIEETGKPELQPADWPAFQRAITEAFLVDTLSISAKALEVLNEHERVFLQARVLTDLRPVFRLEIAQAPAAVVAVHTLKVVYSTGDRPNVFYIGLDSQDIKILMETLQRAIEKENSLRVLAENKGLTLLEVKR